RNFSLCQQSVKGVAVGGGQGQHKEPVGEQGRVGDGDPLLWRGKVECLLQNITPAVVGPRQGELPVGPVDSARLHLGNNYHIRPRRKFRRIVGRVGRGRGDHPSRRNEDRQRHREVR